MPPLMSKEYISGLEQRLSDAENELVRISCKHCNGHGHLMVYTDDREDCPVCEGRGFQEIPADIEFVPDLRLMINFYHSIVDYCPEYEDNIDPIQGDRENMKNPMDDMVGPVADDLLVLAKECERRCNLGEKPEMKWVGEYDSSGVSIPTASIYFHFDQEHARGGYWDLHTDFAVLFNNFCQDHYWSGPIPAQLFAEELLRRETLVLHKKRLAAIEPEIIHGEDDDLPF